MSSKDQILSAVQKSQPSLQALPDLNFAAPVRDHIEHFTSIATGIGSRVMVIDNLSQISDFVKQNYGAGDRVVSTIKQFSDFAETDLLAIDDPHTFENVELALFPGHFGVAENGAVWITEDYCAHRVLPFICQHLALIVNMADIVPTMHQAYERIGDKFYGYSTFISGPSKTADIEQSLVVGAHGSRSMTIFLTRDNLL